MPTALREGPYRFHFVSFDCNEPPHVHVQRDDCEAKIWLEEVQVQNSYNYPAHELRAIEKIVIDRQSELLERWYEHCGHR